MTRPKTQKILTMRQYVFLKWLYQRKTNNHFCDLTNTGIQCFNCLGQKNDCRKGVIPASFFYKKIARQYFDCKRVLDSLVSMGLIKELTDVPGKDFHLYYSITEKGIPFVEEYEATFWLN